MSTCDQEGVSVDNTNIHFCVNHRRGVLYKERTNSKYMDTLIFRLYCCHAPSLSYSQPYETNQINILKQEIHGSIKMLHKRPGSPPIFPKSASNGMNQNLLIYRRSTD